MYWIDKLKKFKAETSETYKSIAQKTGIPKTTVEKIFNGRTADPKLLIITRIVNCLGHGVEELVLQSVDGGLNVTRDEEGILRRYRALDMKGKIRVTDTIAAETDRLEAESAAQPPSFSALYYDFPVSAGTGEYLDYRTAKIIELDTKPPSGTDFVLRVSGDSMEPEFSDGDFVFVESGYNIDHGEIGIFSICGSVYMKKYDRKGLVSLNPKYKTIPGSEDVRCLGRVLGKVKKGT